MKAGASRRRPSDAAEPYLFKNPFNYLRKSIFQRSLGLEAKPWRFHSFFHPTSCCVEDFG